MPENHETWHGVMTLHQHAAVISLAELGQALFGLYYTLIEFLGI